jgi:3-phenylpropionate/trans-cinnamate dioxygenase ferredoxin reductase subunit
MIAVVGGSLGGLRAAEQLRAHGYEGGIVVIGDEVHPPYNRPPLSKELLANPGTPEEALESVLFRQRASVADVDWRLGTKVVASDLKEKHLTLDTGEVLSYAGLVIASGLRPRRLSLRHPLGSRYVLRTLEDSLALHDALRPGRRVVVVGAGFIGCEVAAAARQRGCIVTVIEGASGPMERSLGSELSAAMRKFLATEGITFREKGRVTGLITGTSGTCAGVTLDDGSAVPADVVVESIGSVANTEWLTENGLDLSDGVLCDESLRVIGAEHVVAVGDIARFPDALLGGPARRVEHWATPGDTAKIAAKTLQAALAGEPIPFASAPLPSFWTDLFGVRLQGVGTPALATSTEVLEGSLSCPEAGVAVAYHRDESLVGVVTVGLPSSTQIHYRALVVEARDATPSAYSSPIFP